MTTPPDPSALWSDGFVCVPRRWYPKDRIADETYSKREAKVDLLFLANHDERNGLPSGCCDPSLSFLAVRWKWQRSKVVRFLKRLEKESIIRWEKWADRRNKVTRFLAYEPPRADTLTTQRKMRSRYTQSPSLHGFSDPPRHIPIVPSDTVPDPNRTKRVGSAKKVEVREEKRACPQCWQIEIGADQAACGRCIGLESLGKEITEWQSER